ncbi:MAG: hypothetical protein ABJI69_10135 [Balneola sp.]
MSQVSSELSAKQSIKIIEGIENVDELNAHVDDAEDRTTVLSASDKRFTELTEVSTSTNETEDENEPVDETETSKGDDESPEDETETSDEIVTDELVTPEFLADVAEVVQNKVAAEKKYKGQNVDHTVTDLKQAHVDFEKSVAPSEKAIGFSKQKFKDFCKAVANQANVDQQRRGLSQPSTVDKALFDLHKELNG